jgi:hypothetical protein
MTTDITPLQLGWKVVDYLGLKPGESIDIARLRNGAVLLSRPEVPQE